MDIISTTSPQSTAGALLSKILSTYADKPILLLLSGGSAFALLEHVTSSVLKSHITLGVLDERYDATETVNNFAQLSQLPFFMRAVGQGCSYIDTKIKAAESLPDFTNRYASALKDWQKNNPAGVVIATLGMGADGHTAGIFPDQAAAFLPTTESLLSYELATTVNRFTKRVTVTPQFMTEEITAAVAFVVGAEKYPALASVIAGRGK